MGRAGVAHHIRQSLCRDTVRRHLYRCLQLWHRSRHLNLDAEILQRRAGGDNTGKRRNELAQGWYEAQFV